MKEEPWQSEARRAGRVATSFPCRLLWEGEVIQGRISNISMTGAYVTDLEAIPTEGALISIAFEFTDEDVTLKVALTSIVARKDQSNPRSVGLEFREPSKRLWPLLSPVLKALCAGE